MNITHAPLFKSFFITLILIGILNALAYIFHLFTAVDNFDMLMHFLGGFFISISVLAFKTRDNPDMSYGKLLVWGFGFAFLTGILWECYELYFNITTWGVGAWPSKAYIADNGMDITMDSLGAFLAVWYAHITLKKYE